MVADIVVDIGNNDNCREMNGVSAFDATVLRLTSFNSLLVCSPPPPSPASSSCPDVHEESRSPMSYMNPPHLVNPGRANSVRSVSSTNSNVSLSRRPRIRSRSGTASSQRVKTTGQLEDSPENTNYTQQDLTAEPGPSTQPTSPRSAKSAHRVSASSVTLGLNPAPTDFTRRPATAEASLSIAPERGRNPGARSTKVSNGYHVYAVSFLTIQLVQGQ